jgi:hypothetical protein
MYTIQMHTNSSFYPSLSTKTILGGVRKAKRFLKDAASRTDSVKITVYDGEGRILFQQSANSPHQKYYTSV